MTTLEVVDAATAVVTDLGRRAERIGLSSHGVLDRRSAAVAQALVGNALGAPLVENTLNPLVLRARVDVLCAVAGADVPISVDDAPTAHSLPFSVRRGQTVRVGAARSGLRSYLAVRGGLDVATYAGSCAPDLMIGFGRMLRAGDVLAVHHASAPMRHPGFGLPLVRALDATFAVPPASGPTVVEVTVGPDAAQFGATAGRLHAGPFTVGGRSNAMGIRLSGDVPVREVADEILSVGVPPGAVEVTGGDEIIVLHRSRGVTAGYAIPAVVTAQGLDRLAQVRPGDVVRFAPVTSADAVRALRSERARIDDLAARMRTVLAAHGLGAVSGPWGA